MQVYTKGNVHKQTCQISLCWSVPSPSIKRAADVCSFLDDPPMPLSACRGLAGFQLMPAADTVVAFLHALLR